MALVWPLYSSQFQSTLPARGATKRLAKGILIAVISIHAPREGSDDLAPDDAITGGISIHAPREGSDNLAHLAVFRQTLISIHAPREGSDAGTVQ